MGYSMNRDGRGPGKGSKMTEMHVHIVRLEPMRVASVCVVSPSPERDAWKKLRAWAERAGLLDDLGQHPVFGFNNPSPKPGARQYGYEFWIRVDPDVEAGDGVHIKHVEGGMYAVATCEGAANVGATWKRLFDYVQAPRRSYKYRSAQELEKPHNPCAAEDKIVFDLYLPVAERRNGS
jgi:DNA gyrase inhibitor GyrI